MVTVTSAWPRSLPARPDACAERADAVCRSVRIIRHATSLGGTETTMERRARYRAETATPPSLRNRLADSVCAPSPVYVAV